MNHLGGVENEKAAQPVKDVRQIFQERIAALDALVNELHPECFKEQAHLDSETRERAYWHYGYLVALQDVLALLSSDATKLH